MSEQKICPWCGDPLPPGTNGNRIYHTYCSYEVEDERRRRINLRRHGIIVEGPFKKGAQLTERITKPGELKKPAPKKQPPADKRLSTKETMERIHKAFQDPSVILRQNQLLKDVEDRKLRLERRKEQEAMSIARKDPFTMLRDIAADYGWQLKDKPVVKVPECKEPRRFSEHRDEEGREWIVESRGTGFYGAQ